MTLKQQVHALIEELPDDSAYLREIRESLRLTRALDQAEDDVRNGRLHTSEEFMAKVHERWPLDGNAAALKS
jgi:hypothetical protein